VGRTAQTVAASLHVHGDRVRVAGQPVGGHRGHDRPPVDERQQQRTFRRE